MNTFSDFEKIVDIPISKQRSTATRKIDHQVLIDEDMKQKWDEAKDSKERTAGLIAVKEMALHILKQVGNCDTGNLVQLVKQYADLSLAGSCTMRAKSTVKFLEDKAKARSVRGENRPDTVKVDLDHMKRKLELLNKLEEDLQKGVSG